MIADKSNLRIISEGVQQVVIRSADFEEMLDDVHGKTFFYFDPPYKPLNQTSSFNSYSKGEFDDNEQVRLKEFCDVLDEKGHKWLLSNSDPVDEDGNRFFDDLFSSYKIERVEASRSINSKADKRGS